MERQSAGGGGTARLGEFLVEMQDWLDKLDEAEYPFVVELFLRSDWPCEGAHNTSWSTFGSMRQGESVLSSSRDSRQTVKAEKTKVATNANRPRPLRTVDPPPGGVGSRFSSRVCALSKAFCLLASQQVPKELLANVICLYIVPCWLGLYPLQSGGISKYTCCDIGPWRAERQTINAWNQMRPSNFWLKNKHKKTKLSV